MSPASLALLGVLASLAGGDAQTVLFRAPVSATGALEPAVVDTMTEHMDEQIARTSFEGRPPPDPTACTTAQCWSERAGAQGAQYQIHLHVDASGADQRLTLDITEVATASVVVQESRTCELCGRDELLDATDDLIATGLRKLKSHDAVTTALVVDSDPPGATVTLDGVPVGTTPLEQEVDPGAHALEIASDGYVSQSKSVEVERGTTAALRFALGPVATPPPAVEGPAPPRRARVITGAALVGTGIAAIAGGITLMVIHGRPVTSDCSGESVDLDGDCAFLHDTRIAGAVMVAAGGAAAITGSVVLGIEFSRRRTARVSVGPTPTGLLVRGRF